MYQTVFTQGKVRKFGFLKNPVSKWGWRALKKCCENPVFELKTFFGWRLEFFLRIVRPCSRYLKGLPNLVLYVRKKIRTIQYVCNKKLMQPGREVRLGCQKTSPEKHNNVI